MKTCDEVTIEKIKNLLGWQIVSCSSNRMMIYSDHLVSLERNMVLSFKNEKNFKYLLIEGHVFIEDDNSNVYYDYTIANLKNNSTLNNAEVHLETSPIVSVEIYGRETDEKIGIEEWKNQKTDDLFIFRCQNGEELKLLFHPFFPEIRLLIKNSWYNPLEDIRYDYALRYSLTVKNQGI